MLEIGKQRSIPTIVPYRPFRLKRICLARLCIQAQRISHKRAPAIIRAKICIHGVPPEGAE
jgi:hypothetical protein